jgi:FtsP/CotA-like multicopper oxidase with cupredoxin domain
VSLGSCLGYNLVIPSDHCGGTFWYHSHIHEYTRNQVANGAYGFLIIEDQRADGTYMNVPTTATTDLKTFFKYRKVNVPRGTRFSS